MQTARVFNSGNSKTIRLPDGFQLNGEEVEIFQRGDEIVIREIPKKVRTNLAEAFKILTEMPDDFFAEGREDTLPQERDFF